MTWSDSAISWTEKTWNLYRGCTAITHGDGSPSACDNCYAESTTRRAPWGSDLPWTPENADRVFETHPEYLDEPYRKDPALAFVNSISDTFHPLAVARGPLPPATYWIMETIRDTPRHTYQLLTKRPHLAARFDPMPDNVWLGTSVGSRAEKPRIEQLRDVEAPVKFVSFEPLLESLGDVDLEGIDWVIVGGESGDGFREMKPAWVRELHREAQATETAWFFKQSSAYQNETITDPSLEYVYREMPCGVDVPDPIVDAEQTGLADY